MFGDAGSAVRVISCERMQTWIEILDKLTNDDR